MVMDRKYHKKYSREYYHDRKNEYINKLGGKCAICKGEEDLEFDHINANDKNFPIGKLLNVSKEEAEKELLKCQLLCHKCHAEKSVIDLREKRRKTSKLNIEQVREIKKLLKDGLTQTAIAKLYNVGPMTISSIDREITWKDA